MHATVLAAHIIAGSVGIIAGFIALFAAKGQLIHRSAGRAFVYAIVAMGVIGSTMAIVWNKAPGANGPIGLLVAYLVLTALFAVRPPGTDARRIDIGLAVVVATVSVFLFGFTAAIVAGVAGPSRGFAFPAFIFGAIAASALVGDARMIRAGGSAALRGVPRIYRHLWRMCTALLIAAFSFFLGQAKVIPKPIRIVPLLVIPPLLVLAAMLYWIWRVRVRKSLRGLAAPPVVSRAVVTHVLIPERT